MSIIQNYIKIKYFLALVLIFLVINKNVESSIKSKIILKKLVEAGLIGKALQRETKIIVPLLLPMNMGNMNKMMQSRMAGIKSMLSQGSSMFGNMKSWPAPSWPAPSWPTPSWSEPSWSSISWEEPSWSSSSWSEPSWSEPSWNDNSLSELSWS